MAIIKEAAVKAGVSVATVSHALNDSRKVRPETWRRLLRAAKELGCLPNTAARSLVVGRSSIAGLIVPDIGNLFSRNDQDCPGGSESLRHGNHRDERQ